MSENSKNQLLVLGDEAVSYAAIDAGAKGIFGYPGTPSTEVFECAAHLVENLDDGRIAKWAANEKVAYEMAMGASYSGHRSIVTMKHVGLNVAMDPFVNSAITGIQGGLVVLVADDPGMHSSQNEQDSRYLAEFAKIPFLEPSTPQEAYDLTLKAFELSEKLKLPVVIRLVTRLAHSRGTLDRGVLLPPESIGMSPKEEKARWVLVPDNARKQFVKLTDREPEMLDTFSSFNQVQQTDSKKGVFLAGMGRSYYKQLFRSLPELKAFSIFEMIGNPVRLDDMKAFLDSCDTVYVFEENYPFIEDKLLSLTKTTDVHGRRDGSIPLTGELSLLNIQKALGFEVPETKEAATITVPGRPPRLCDGCGHIDAFNAIQQAFKNVGVEDPRVFGDIGCYTLGTLAPFNAIDACLEMGASMGMTIGAGSVGMNPALGVIGDSTFFHSGLTPLMSLMECDGNINLVVLDNRITAMTGHQKTISINAIENIAKAIGLDDGQIHILTPLPKRLEENTKAMEAILKHDGPDLIIFRRDCIEAMRKGSYKKLYKDN